MREAIKECYLVTEQLHSFTEDKELIDEQIEKITSLLKQREELLKQVVPPFTVEEKRFGCQMVAWNEEIDANLNAIKQTIGSKIKELKHSKKTLPKYNAYGAPAGADAYFYDKKK